MLKRLIIFISIFSLAVFPLFFRHTANAAALETLSDTLTRLDNSTLSSHDILFTLPAAETLDSDQTITYDFNEDGSDWAVDGASSVVADFDFTTVKTSTTEAVILDVTVGAPDCTGESGANDIAIGIDDATGVVSVEMCSTFTSSDAASTINLEYGTAATDNGSGTNRVTNPAAPGSTVLAIDHASATNTGSLAVPIMTEDQVTVSATVDPTISSTLSSATCLLGTLSSTSINVCTYSNTVLTNAASGFTSTILDDGNLRNASDDVDDAAGDNDVDQGSEEYGVSSDDTTAVDIIETDGTGCDGTDDEDATAITPSAQSYATHNGPVGSGDADEVTNLCHAASVLPTTPAGSYSHITTHITTGIF